MPDARCYRQVRAASGATCEGITPRSSLLRAHASDRLPLPAFGTTLYGESLQVVVSPLLQSGPSRRYPCPPDAGAWTLTPQSPSGARARCFPEGTSCPCPDRTCSALIFPCHATSTGGSFRGCSHSFIFRLPRSLDPRGTRPFQPVPCICPWETSPLREPRMAPDEEHFL